METLNPEVQVIINRFKDFTSTLSDMEREKLRMEKERILSLNQKLYRKTGALKKATPEELKKYKRNTNKLTDLKNILIQDGASE